MNMNDWMKIKIINNLLKAKKKLSVGDEFLTGESMISQRDVKKEIGERVSFYVVKKKNKNSIEYMTKIDTLRREK